MCGIIGLLTNGQVSNDLFRGLEVLQHRGQDAAGICTFDQQFYIQKSLGLVQDIFTKKSLQKLKGNTGIGHVRYTTRGKNDLKNAQPLVLQNQLNIAMVHNGNITNVEELTKELTAQKIKLNFTNDLEILLHIFNLELQKQFPKKIIFSTLVAAVRATQKKVRGAYATLALIGGYGLLGFASPQGIRPLILGQKKEGNQYYYALASETVCFDRLGYQRLRDLEAGEIVFIDNNHQLHSYKPLIQKQYFCVFEYLYFAKANSYLQGYSVAEQRLILGQRLARQIQQQNLKPDIVIDVPSSGYFAAEGLAMALGIPHQKALIKNPKIGRSFIADSPSKRTQITTQKYSLVSHLVKAKKVAVVDDSIVRGTTAKHIVKLLKQAGATAVYFISSAPPFAYPCVYGIDISSPQELIAANASPQDISDYIGADALIFQTVEELKQQFETLGVSICTACLTGVYPV